MKKKEKGANQRGAIWHADRATQEALQVTIVHTRRPPARCVSGLRSDKNALILWLHRNHQHTHRKQAQINSQTPMEEQPHTTVNTHIHKAPDTLICLISHHWTFLPPSLCLSLDAHTLICFTTHHRSLLLSLPAGPIINHWSVQLSVVCVSVCGHEEFNQACCPTNERSASSIAPSGRLQSLCVCVCVHVRE